MNTKTRLKKRKKAKERIRRKGIRGRADEMKEGITRNKRRE